MSGLTLSKISSSLMMLGPNDTKVNAGLNLKFEAKSLKVLGYTRKTESGWEFSTTGIELIMAYKVGVKHGHCPSVVVQVLFCCVGGFPRNHRCFR